MKWSQQQLSAIDVVQSRIAAREPVTRMFGFAGTGKTTLAKTLAEKTGGNVLFAAYTGKAASVLTRKGCRAQTIHSLIYKPAGDIGAKIQVAKQEIGNLEAAAIRGATVGQTEKLAKLQRELKALRKQVGSPGFVFAGETSSLVNANLLVLDEVSMVDDKMANDLQTYGVPILALGDPAQLPPVGGNGYFTRGGEEVADAMLTKVERHAGYVIDLATKVRETHSQPRPDGQGVRRRISLRAAAEFDQVLVGTNATRWSKNRALREQLGLPEGEEVVKGERIICLANNKDLRVLNGQQFRVLDVRDCDTYGAVELLLECECGLPVNEQCGICSWTVCWMPVYTYGFKGMKGESELKEMPYGIQQRAMHATYGYAITVHKSQGSEWGRVLVVDESPVFRKDAWRWLYTAITRAQEEVVVLQR